MCAYSSRAEDKSSEAMKQAVKEAMKRNLSSYEQMKTIARAYITKRECSVQEAIYHVIPELWLRKSYALVIFINTNLPEKPCRICRKEEEINELPVIAQMFLSVKWLIDILSVPIKHSKIASTAWQTLYVLQNFVHIITFQRRKRQTMRTITSQKF